MFRVRLGGSSILHHASLVSHGLVCQACMVASTSDTLAHVSWLAISASLSGWHSASNQQHDCLLPSLARAAQRLESAAGAAPYWQPPVVGSAEMSTHDVLPGKSIPLTKRSNPAQLWCAGGECGIPYEYRFDLPYPTGEGATFTADNGNNYSSLWYSFDQGPGKYASHFRVSPASHVWLSPRGPERHC